MSLYSDLNEVLTPYANKINGLSTDVGNLSGLDTEDKSNLVAAINETAQTGENAISQLSADLADVTGWERCDFSDYTTKSVGLGSSGKWLASATSYFIPIDTSCGKIKLYTNMTQGSVVAFLTSDVYTLNSKVTTYATYADGSERMFIPAGSMAVLDVPSDATYLYVLNTWPGEGSYLPNAVYMYDDNKDKPDDAYVQRYGLDVSNYRFRSGYCVLADTGILSASSNLSASDYIPTYGCHWMTLTVIWPNAINTGNVKYGWCFYDKDKNALPWSGGIVPIARPDGVIARIKTIDIGIPNNAVYLRTTWWVTPNESEVFHAYLRPLYADKDITNERPATRGIEYAIRRARQLADVKWTPVVDVPRYVMADGGNYHFEDWFKAGIEYTGIPYSGSGETETWAKANSVANKHFGYYMLYAGSAVDLETFVTAMRYPNSVITCQFSDDPSGSESRGQRKQKYDANIYGIVCSGFVSYCLGLPLPPVGIGGFKNTASQRVSYAKFLPIISSIAESTKEAIASDIRVGDILWSTKHVIIVTDLFRDASGTVVALEQGESTSVGGAGNMNKGGQLGGMCRRKTFSLDEFYERYGSYGIYRFVDFTNVTYTPSRYVDTGNEGNRKGIADMPVIPWCGNKFKYKVDHIPNTKLLIGLHNFTSLVVLKDGETFNTFTITPETEEIEVGFTDIGEYSAYLTDGTNNTMSCQWSVVAEDSVWPQVN